jgi:(R,R)-butanediol dehydrogenase / meso-butanediol dehydrogenase / diacetyl reductase
MRAALFQAAGKPLVIERIADPRPRTDQVLIEVQRAGICGSDLHMSEYGAVPAGTIFGHEFAGTVAELGSAVASGWRVGDRVTALPVQACHDCDACGAGLPALCRGGLFTGTNLSYPGAYAEYVGARASMVQRLPPGVSFACGALVEPLAVAHHAVELAGVARGMSVLVLGAGPIGAGVVLFARLAGARHVIVSERTPERRDIALALGATAVIDPLAEDVAARCATLAGAAPQIVFECVGVAGLLQQAIALAGVRGRVLVAGVCFAPDQILPLTGLMKEVNVQFSQCYTERNFAAVIDAIAERRAQPEPMHTHTVGFQQLPEMFEQLRTRPRGCKVLLDPRL